MLTILLQNDFTFSFINVGSESITRHFVFILFHDSKSHCNSAKIQSMKKIKGALSVQNRSSEM